jgi:hypothetical protein
VEFHEVP